jgi:hypothetical protein
MVDRPETVLQGRPRLGKVEKGLVLARSMIGAAA